MRSSLKKFSRGIINNEDLTSSLQQTEGTVFEQSPSTNQKDNKWNSWNNSLQLPDSEKYMEMPHALRLLICQQYQEEKDKFNLREKYTQYDLGTTVLKAYNTLSP